MAGKIVGLDLGARAIKMVVMEPGRQLRVLSYDEEVLWPPKPPEAAAPEEALAEAVGEDEVTEVRDLPGDRAAEEPTTDEDAPVVSPWEQALRALVERNDLQDAVVVCQMPGNQAMTLRVPVMFDEKPKVSAVLPALLADRLPMNPAEVSWDFRVEQAPAGSEMPFEALVGFAPREAVAAALDRLQTQGVDPAEVLVPELALGRLAQSIGPTAPESFALVDMGHEATRVVVWHRGRPVLARTIRRGGRQVTEALAQAFQLPVEEAERVKREHGVVVLDPSSLEGLDPSVREQVSMLSDGLQRALQPLSRELRRSLQSLLARDRIAVEKVYLCGGASMLKNTGPWLARELGVEVDRLRLGDVLPGGGTEALGGQWALALALALRPPAHPETINLRTGALAYRGRSSYLRGQMMWLGAAAAMLLVMLAVALFTKQAEVEAQRDAMRAAVSKETAELFDKPILSPKKLEERLVGEQVEQKSFIPKVSAYELLHRIVTAVDANNEFEVRRLEVDIDRNLVQLYGTTKDAQQVDQIVTDLESIECLKEIKKDKLKVRRDEQMDFELQILSSCS